MLHAFWRMAKIWLLRMYSSNYSTTNPNYLRQRWMHDYALYWHLDVSAVVMSGLEVLMASWAYTSKVICRRNNYKCSRTRRVANTNVQFELLVMLHY